MKTVKDYVKNNQKVYFQFYRQNILYYKTEDDTLLFEVPISDVGTGLMSREDKAILYMRWIRKQLEANEQGLAESTV